MGQKLTDGPFFRMYRFDHPEQTTSCFIWAPTHEAARRVVNERYNLLKLSPNLPVTFVVMPIAVEEKDDDE
jgi:hypothetical protein